MIAAGVALLIVAYLFYVLFIKGWIFGIILFLFGTIGGTITILSFFPKSRETAVIIGSMHFNYAITISVLLMIVGVAVISEGGHHN